MNYIRLHSQFIPAPQTHMQGNPLRSPTIPIPSPHDHPIFPWCWCRSNCIFT